MALGGLGLACQRGARGLARGTNVSDFPAFHAWLGSLLGGRVCARIDCIPRGALTSRREGPLTQPTWEPDRMTSRPEIVFQPLSADLEPTVVVLAGDDVALGSRSREIDQRAGGALLKAAEAAQYKGRKKSTVEVLAPPRLGGVNRVILLGTGKPGELQENDWVLLGGSAAGAIGARKTKSASLIAEAARRRRHQAGCARRAASVRRRCYETTSSAST